MPGRPEPLKSATTDDERPPPRRRLTAVAVIGVLCLLALGAGIFAVLRSDGGGETAESIPEVTFGPEGDATTIAEPPPGGVPAMGLSLDSGPAGSEVTLQGAGFQAGRDVRPVEVYWDAPDSPPLKSVNGPKFSVQVKIPDDADVRPNGHDIIAIQRSKDGKLLSQTAIRFFVVPARR